MTREKWYERAHAVMLERTGLLPVEYEDRLEQWYEDGETPEAFARWFIAKYGLEDLRAKQGWTPVGPDPDEGGS